MAPAIFNNKKTKMLIIKINTLVMKVENNSDNFKTSFNRCNPIKVLSCLIAAMLKFSNMFTTFSIST